MGQPPGLVADEADHEDRLQPTIASEDQPHSEQHGTEKHKGLPERHAEREKIEAVRRP